MASPVLLFLLTISFAGGIVILLRIAILFSDTTVSTDSLLGEVRLSLIALGASLGVPFLVWRTIVLSHNSRVLQNTHHSDVYFQAIDKLGELKEPTSKFFGHHRKSQESDEAIADSVKVPNIEVRVGAINSLFRILEESDELYWPIVQTLTTYLELNELTPGEYMSETELTELLEFQTEQRPLDYQKRYDEIATAYGKVNRRFPYQRADMRTVLEVLAHKHPPNSANERKHIRPNLGRRNLQRATLQGAILNYASLSYVRGEGCDLRFADLSFSNLHNAKFDGGRLRGVRLHGALIAGTSFARADVRGYEREFRSELEHAYGDVWTVLPEGIERPHHWKSSSLDWRVVHDAFADFAERQGRRWIARY
ncbi:MAG: pentapeptide repeat-containing protein [Litorimonas sp.]